MLLLFITVAYAGTFIPNDIVIIHDLQARPDLNERLATVTSESTSKDRIGVKLEINGAKFSLKPEKLTKAFVCSICANPRATEIEMLCGHKTICTYCVGKISTNSADFVQCPMCRKKQSKEVGAYRPIFHKWSPDFPQNVMFQEFFGAIRVRNTSLAAEILKHLDRNHEHWNHWMGEALKILLQQQEFGFVKILLEKGAPIKDESMFYFQGNLEILKILVQFGGNVNATIETKPGDPPVPLLALLMMQKDYEAVKILSERGLDLNKGGFVAALAEHGDLEGVKFLLNLGADYDKALRTARSENYENAINNLLSLSL